MNTFEQISLIIFLNIPLDILEERLDDKESRGIVGLKTLSISKLYEQRIPLYMKYADIIINCGYLSPSEIVKRIEKQI